MPNEVVYIFKIIFRCTTWKGGKFYLFQINFQSSRSAKQTSCFGNVLFDITCVWVGSDRQELEQGVSSSNVYKGSLWDLVGSSKHNSQLSRFSHLGKYFLFQKKNPFHGNWYKKKAKKLWDLLNGNLVYETNHITFSPGWGIETCRPSREDSASVILCFPLTFPFAFDMFKKLRKVYLRQLFCLVYYIL